MYLNRLHAGLRRHLRDEELGDGGVLCCRLAVVEQLNRTVEKSPSRLALRHHVGQLRLDELPSGDRLSERFPLIRVADAVLERPPGQPQRQGGDHDAASEENPLDIPEPFVDHAEQLVLGHSHVLHVQRHSVGGAHSELVLGPAGAEALGVPIHHEGADAALALRRVRHGQDDERAGAGAVGHKLLRAVQHPRVTVPDGLGPHGGRVGAGYGLGQTPTADPLSRGERGKPSHLLFCSAGNQDVLTAQPVVGLDGESETPVMAGDLLENDGELHVVPVGAAVFFGHEDTHKSLISKDLDHLIRIAFCAVPGLRVRRDLLLREPGYRRSQRHQLFGKVKVHVLSSSGLVRLAEGPEITSVNTP